MPQHADQQCFHCQRMRPYEVLIPSEMLRPVLQETIKKHDANWTPGQMLCVDCLDRLEKNMSRTRSKNKSASSPSSNKKSSGA